MIDIDDILNAPVKGANATSIPVLDDGEYIGTIEKLKVSKFSNKEQTKEFTKLVVTWSVESQEDDLKTQNPIQDVFLDITEEGTLNMAKDKNDRLGVLRKAVGQNEEDEDWSPSMLIGEPACISIVTETYKERIKSIVKFVKAAELYED